MHSGRKPGLGVLTAVDNDQHRRKCSAGLPTAPDDASHTGDVFRGNSWRLAVCPTAHSWLKVEAVTSAGLLVERRRGGGWEEGGGKEGESRKREGQRGHTDCETAAPLEAWIARPPTEAFS